LKRELRDWTMLSPVSWLMFMLVVILLETISNRFPWSPLVLGVCARKNAMRIHGAWRTFVPKRSGGNHAHSVMPMGLWWSSYLYKTFGHSPWKGGGAPIPRWSHHPPPVCRMVQAIIFKKSWWNRRHDIYYRKSQEWSLHSPWCCLIWRPNHSWGRWDRQQ
jgi:hypothetical protein